MNVIFYSFLKMILQETLLIQLNNWVNIGSQKNESSEDVRSMVLSM